MLEKRGNFKESSARVLGDKEGRQEIREQIRVEATNH